MGTPDIQYFGHDGIWVKPAGAWRVDIVLKGGDGGGATVADVGTASAAHGYVGTSDNGGEIKAVSYPADSLPDLMPAEVGKGGRPGGRDGYVLVVTHLA